MSRAEERSHTPDRFVGLDHIDALLDEALWETFPASDPIAVSIDKGIRGSASGKPGSKESIATCSATDGVAADVGIPQPAICGNGVLNARDMLPVLLQDAQDEELL